MVVTARSTSAVARVFALGVVFALGLVALGGCAVGVPKDGQSADQANKSTLLPEGVEALSVTYTSSLSGFNRSYSVVATVSVADGFVVADSDGLVDWLVGVGWSINDHEPTLLRIRILNDAGTSVDVDYSDAISKFNLNAENVAYYLERANVVSFGASKVESVLGSWPGEVPDTPSGLFERAP